MSPVRPICEVAQLGLMPYQQAWDLQNELVAARSRDEIPDQLLLLEHPHIYTLGTSGDVANLLMPPDERDRLGIRVLHVDRGGDITYHGPGQLVGYPIIKLPRSPENNLRADFIGYVRKLEKVIINTLADFGITGKPIAGLTGVWVETPTGSEKICAMGVKINVKAVTKHGFALNVNTDMRYFEGIIPCGIDDKGVTSMAQLRGEPVNMDAVMARLIVHFGAVFGLGMIYRD
ncbi:MAG: lipoyl(octanoyl) transferase LipB [Chloroflexi bacterium]|nr:MAG: lipoyl(octanoyl) transferase LipB [Chloroflexota bacterium]